MKLYITYEEEERPDLDFDWEETASKIGEAVLKAEGFPGEAEVSLVLTSEEEIHRVNRESTLPQMYCLFRLSLFAVPVIFRNC